MIPTIRGLLAVVFMATFFVSVFWNVALPKDNGQFQGINPEIKDWFRSLKSKSGYPCCDFQDGTRVEDPDWKIDERGKFLIRIGDRWFEVPDDAVLDGNNMVGFSVVWISPTTGKIVCFLPGSGT